MVATGNFVRSARTARATAGGPGPDKGRAVPSTPLERIGEPVLVVHHEQDGCGLCAFADGPAAMTCP
jgi:hypothetical protein